MRARKKGTIRGLILKFEVEWRLRLGKRNAGRQPARWGSEPSTAAFFSAVLCPAVEEYRLMMIDITRDKRHGSLRHIMLDVIIIFCLGGNIVKSML